MNPKESSKNEKPDNAPPTEERTHLETFSIGNEFDFLPVADTTKVDIKVEKEPPQRDSLMDALNALDEEEGQSADITEEIVFDSASISSKHTKPIFDDDSAVAITDVGKEQSEALQTESEGDRATIKPTEGSSAVDDLLNSEDDMDALLASADEDFGDLDLADFDDDDDLEDLENMLKA